jgi:uncharacterized membrane protein
MAAYSAFKRFLHNRRLRLYISLLLGMLVFLLTRGGTTLVSFMFSWLTFSLVNLLFSWIVILSFHPREVRTFAEKEDTSGTFIFLFVLTAAFISLFAIVFLLQSVPNASKHGLSFHILLSISSVFCSWLLVHTLFTLRYAHVYYKWNGRTVEKKEAVRALNFPTDNEPDYLDFAYFSFVIGMTFQVSDVSINAREIRRLALLHGFLAFIYNTVIVAFSINIVSGLIAR